MCLNKSALEQVIQKIMAVQDLSACHFLIKNVTY